MTTNQELNKQIERIFQQNKTKIAVAQLQKYFDQHSLNYKIPLGIVNSISKQSYILWAQKGSKNINKLIRNQIYQKIQQRIKQKPEDSEKIINEYDDKLKKIGQKQIQISVYKKSLIEHKTGHIHQTYRALLENFLKQKQNMKQKEQKRQTNQQDKSNKQSNNEQLKKQKQQTQLEKAANEKQKHQNKQSTQDVKNKLQNKQASQPKKQQKIQDHQKVDSITEKSKSEVKQDQKNSQNKVQFILKIFYESQIISEEQLKILKQQISNQISIQKLKKYKQQIPKVLDKQQQYFQVNNIKNWIDKTSKMKQQKEIVNNSQNKQKILTDKRDNLDKKQKIFDFINKYLKPLKNSQSKLDFPKFQAQFKLHSPSQMQNIVQYTLTFLLGQKQITKIVTEYQGRKLISQIKKKQYIVIQILTKRSQQLQQKIEGYIKDKRIKDIQGSKIKTHTQSDKLYLSIDITDEKEKSLSKSITAITESQAQQNFCKIQNRIRFGLGQQGKTKPEDRKLIKSLTNGFEIYMSVSGNSEMNHRFRKNLQLQNSDSSFFTLLSITKNTEFNLNWRKIQDANNFFSRLGVLDALKATPSVKQIIHDVIDEVFHIQGSGELFSILPLMELLISQVQTNKICIHRVDQKNIISLGMQNNVKRILKK